MNVRQVLKPLLIAALLSGGSTALAADVVRYKLPGSDFPIALAVEVPAGTKTFYVSGMGADIADKTQKPDSPLAYGDTKAQALSTLQRIEATLKSMKLEMKDVVKMTVFLVGDPAMGGNIDFAGFMDSYRKFFGGPEHPNLPARSTVKVAGLANPGWLIEIEVVAVAPP
jgi:enamine deaminase RidA (YjgF/YER057c/UK114 family)